MTSSRRWGSRFLRCIAWIAGFVLALMVLVQVLLSPAVCASVVEKYYPRFIDGKLEADCISVSLFSHFPAVSASIRNLSLTYPASRFDTAAADRTDTLASFKRFSVAVNVLSLLHGTINVKALELERPRVFICNYDDGTSNLSVLKLATAPDVSQVEDTSSFVLPRILLRRVRLGDGARIVYDDKTADLRAALLLRNFYINGRVDSDNPLDGRVRIKLDTLLVMGRLRGDTLLFDLDHFALRFARGRARLDAGAKAYAGTRSFGRIKVPLSLGGNFEVANDSILTVSCQALDLNAATVHATADLMAEIGDTIAFRGSLTVPEMDLQTVLDEYVVRFYPDVAGIMTRARFGAATDLDGLYVPSSAEKPALNLKARVDYNGEGLHLHAAGSGRDVLRGKGQASLDARMGLSLDTLDTYFADMLGVNMKGCAALTVSGSLPLSGLSVYNLKNTDLKADASLDGVTLRTGGDSISLRLGNLRLKTALMEDRFGISNRKGARTLGAIVKLDSVSFKYCDSLDIFVSDIGILAQTSPMMNTADGGKKYNPLSVSLSLGKVDVRAADSLSLRLSNSKNRASVVPSDEDRNLPRISLSSDNGRLVMRSGLHRAFLSGLNFSADARMKGRASRGNSLTRSGTDVLQDSSFNLGAIRKYLSRWTVKGDLDLDRMIVATPAFPLRTSAAKFRGSFDNESIRLDSLGLRAGASRLDVNGSISNIRRALSGRGDVVFALNLDSDTLAVSELLNAFAVGQNNMRTDLGYLAQADDEQYEKIVSEAGADSSCTSQTSLIEIPPRLNATVRLRGRRVSFSTLNVDSLSADLKIRDRCVQLGDVAVNTPIGGIYADAFYSTRTRSEVYAGFDFNLSRVSAGEVIDLIPQIDTLMPLIRTFDGLLDCTVAATAQIDTNMNLIMPTLEGVIRITGEDLHFNDNKEITRIARMLWIKNPGRATIDSMKVEGILRDNTLEVFPFLIKMDKWNLAVAGIQNMDNSFSYHVSLAKTPLLIKLGANITGPDFDHMTFSLGKAKYRSDMLPSFSKEIDDSRANLLKSIRNVFRHGVRQAVLDNRSQRDRFRRAREKVNYRRSVSLEALEELSGSDRYRLDSLNAGAGDVPDTLKTAPVANWTDSLETAPVAKNAVNLQ